MAIEAIPQLLDSSVDAVGLSVVSSTMTAENPRYGSMYNSVVLAAGVPVWFHPLQDQRYVALFRSHWINATIGADGPQSYSDHTEAGSCWVVVSPPGGATVALGRIPTRFPGDLVLNGAASRVDYLFTVGTVDGAAIVQHHRVAREGGLVLDGEELMFSAGNLDVLFDKGCYLTINHLVILGTDTAGNVFTARRRWSRIGVPDTTAGWTWEYRSAKGWLPDPATLEPIGLTSVGPVSVAFFKDRLLVSTVALESGVYSAKVFQARVTDPWGRWKLDPTGAPVLLGTDGGTYLGGALYLQPQLGRNPAFALPPGKTGIPYVTSVSGVGDEAIIDTTWGLWPL